MWKLILLRRPRVLLRMGSPCRSICFLSRSLLSSSDDGTFFTLQGSKNKSKVIKVPGEVWESQNFFRWAHKVNFPYFPLWFCYPFSYGLAWLTFGSVKCPQNQLYMGPSIRWVCWTFAKKITSRRWQQSINQAWEPLDKRLVVTAQVLFSWSPPCPSWFKVLLMVKSRITHWTIPISFISIVQESWSNVLFIRGAWWILVNGLLLIEAMTGAPEWMESLR